MNRFLVADVYALVLVVQFGSIILIAFITFTTAFLTARIRHESIRTNRTLLVIARQLVQIADRQGIPAAPPEAGARFEPHTPSPDEIVFAGNIIDCLRLPADIFRGYKATPQEEAEAAKALRKLGADSVR